MAISEIKKVQILAHASVKMDLLSFLQEEGLIQIEKTDVEELEFQRETHEISQMDHRLHSLSQALEYLSQWDEEGFAKKLFAQKPRLDSKRREEILNFDYPAVLETIEEIEAEKKELLSDIKFLKREEELLFPFKNLELPINLLKPSKDVEVLLGWLPQTQLRACQEIADEEPIWYEVISQSKRDVYIIFVYYKREKARLLQAGKEIGFTPFLFTDSILRLSDEKDRIEELIIKIKKEIEKRKRKLVALDKQGLDLFQHRDKLMLIHDVLLNERKKISSLQLLGETDRVFYLEGWAQSSDIQKIKSKLNPLADFTEIYSRSPLPDEDPPVILENPRPVRPFEMITKLYGLPLRRSLDPTLWLAPFFFIFVGLCVSEAGYGILVALVSFLYIKFAKPKGGFLIFLKLLSLLGVSTVILGALVGGWFGFPIRKLMILDPLKDPLSFLILSLILGFIQVWFGTLLNMIDGIRNKNYLQAIAVQGGWLLLLPSLVLYLLIKNSLWGILTLVGAAGVVFFSKPSRNPLSRFFGGLYSLYDISRYLADVLSYSRLLALGLATSVIAMVVNTLSETALGIPWLGWFLAALIFVGGHLFNLGISFLGGFVHSMRLQFVEFFSKFFKSGGRSFKPFALEGKYIEFI